MFGSLNQGQLVWTGRLVDYFTCFRVLVDDHGVADREQAEEEVQGLALIPTTFNLAISVQMLRDGALHDLDRTFNHSFILVDSIYDIVVCLVPIYRRTDLDLSQLHFVPRERASLVGEYEFDLAQFLD